MADETRSGMKIDDAVLKELLDVDELSVDHMRTHKWARERRVTFSALALRALKKPRG